MVKRHSRNCRGVSVIEILIALAILSLGIYGVGSLMSASRNSAALASNKLRAGGLARLKFEELANAGAALREATASGRPTKDGGALVPADGAKTFEQDARYQWRATLAPDGADADRVHVTVEVMRPEAGDAPVLARMRGWAYVPAGEGGV